MDGDWTLVEYRPGRYAKVALDGAVIGKASETEVRTWFAAHSKKQSRTAPSQEPGAPAQEPTQVTRESRIQAWFANQRQERQSKSPPSDAPADSTTEEAGKLGIRDWLAAQKRDLGPGTSPASSDRPAVRTEGVAVEPQSPDQRGVDEKGDSPAKPAVATAESEIAGAGSEEKVQKWGILPETRGLQAELPPAGPGQAGPEPRESDSVPATGQATDARKSELSSKDLKNRATKARISLDADRTSPMTEIVQLALLSGMGEGDKDSPSEEQMAPTREPEPVLVEPLPARVRQSALPQPSSPSSEEVIHKSRALEPAETSSPKPDQPAVELIPTEVEEESPTAREGDAANVTDAELILPTIVSPPPDSPELNAGSDIDTDEDVDWLEPGTPPANPADLDQIASVQPSIARDSGRGNTGAQAAQNRNTAPSEPLAADVSDRWLWVDPRQARGYDAGAFDPETFLSSAVALFQNKAWTGGREPARLAAHPDEVANGLKAVGESLGLEVISDPRVTAGTYRLALAPSQDS